MLTADGAVYALGGALYHGAPNAVPNAHWPEGHRRGARIEPHGSGYVITDTTGERYSYGT